MQMRANPYSYKEKCKGSEKPLPLSLPLKIPLGHIGNLGFRAAGSTFHILQERKIYMYMCPLRNALILWLLECCPLPFSVRFCVFLICTKRFFGGSGKGSEKTTALV
jgi:hypothetical protein